MGARKRSVPQSAPGLRLSLSRRSWLCRSLSLAGLSTGGDTRKYKEAVFWATGFALTVVGGYAIVWWREPLMLKHVAALRHPVLEYRQALVILWDAVSQPVVPFAAIGGFLALWKRAPERLLFLIYCVVAWLVAILTIRSEE